MVVELLTTIERWRTTTTSAAAAATTTAAVVADPADATTAAAAVAASKGADGSRARVEAKPRTLDADQGRFALGPARETRDAPARAATPLRPSVAAWFHHEPSAGQDSVPSGFILRRPPIATSSSVGSADANSTL